MAAQFLSFEKSNLDWKQFENFILAFLSCQVSIEVLSRSGLETSEATPQTSAVHRITGAQPYGGEGDDQQGIDLVATTDKGEEWVFQCKHTRSFGQDDVRKAIDLANQEYPHANRYFLFVSGVVKPKGLSLARSQPKWEVWDGRTISSHFFTKVPPRQAFTIVAGFFGEAEARRLFPLTDQLLISPEEFYLPWTRENQLFHHKAPLVGRHDELSSVSDFLRNPTARVCILVARGGIGKTRLLKGLAERIREDFPDREILFVNPAAARDAAPNSLRWNQDGQVVIIQDDAHRLEMMNPHLIASLVQKEPSKLVLAARPQAIGSLKEFLLKQGYSSLQIAPLITLKPLKRAELEALASNLLGKEFRHLAGSLAQTARGCALIVSVGAEIITRNLLTAPRLDGSSEFQDEVFSRLEGEELKRLAEGGSFSALKTLLRALAILSPWENSESSATALSAFVGCSRTDLTVFLESLESAGLIMATRSGLRVSPDLFADHLVYSACYDKSGKLTPFAHRIRSDLLRDYSVPVLRNLAEAEWRSLQDSNAAESILGYFWEGIRTKFDEADIFEKATILEQWQSFSVFQPERALTLASSALSAVRATGTIVAHDDSIEDFSRRHLLNWICGTLLPVAIYNDEHRTRCLDLFWEVSKLSSTPRNHENQHPWKTIANVGAFQRNHPLSAPEGLLTWLSTRLDLEDFGAFVNQPSEFLRMVFRPIFARTVDDSYSEGRVVHFRSLLVNAGETSSVRTFALELLEKKVAPLGDCGALNSLSVIEEALSPITGHFGGEVSQQYLDSWQGEKAKLVSLIGSILRLSSSFLIAFRARDILRTTIRWTESDTIRADCERLLESIPDSLEVRTMRLSLSDAYSEFDEPTPSPRPENYSEGQELERVREKWTQFHQCVAKEWIDRVKTAKEFLESLTSILRYCADCGFFPNLGTFFREVARQNAPLADQMVDFILLSPTRELDAWWTFLFEFNYALSDGRVQRWILQALAQQRPALKHMALHLVNARRGEAIPEELLVKICDWAKTASKDDIPILLHVFRGTLYGEEILPQRILEALDISRWEEKEVASLITALGHAHRANDGVLPVALVDRVFEFAHRLSNLDQEDAARLIRRVARQSPRRVFDFFLKRILDRPSSDNQYRAIPWRCEWGLTGLERESDYPTISEDLLHKLRVAPREKRSDWVALFRMAVLWPSDIGIALLIRWAREAHTSDEMNIIIGLLAYRGSGLIFRHPSLVSEILRNSLKWPSESESLRTHLADSGCMVDRSHRNGKPDPGSSQIVRLAEECSTRRGEFQELADFYREVAVRERRRVEYFDQVAQREFESLDEE